MNQTPSLRITSTFVAEPVAKCLRFLLNESIGLECRFSFSEFNQVFQEALDPGSGSSRNDGGINLFLVRPEDLSEAPDLEMAAELCRAIEGLDKRASAKTLVVICPHHSRSEAGRDWENAVRQQLEGETAITLITSGQLERDYPVAEPFDLDSENSGRIPFTSEMFAALGTAIARATSLQSRKPAKVIVLDADNTLWGGVVGEDGPAGLKLDGPWKEFADFMVKKHDEGFVLALASKNRSEDIDAVFAERADEFSLKPEHFAARKVNWKPKSENLFELSSELNLGLDSFIFIDDNPAEIAEVTANCPGVTAIQLPRESSQIPKFVQNLWCLDKTAATGEDSLRTAFYRDETRRRELLESSDDFAKFLRELDLSVAIHEAEAEERARISQLSLRTNQFNANPVRFTEAEIDNRLSYETVAVSDRFGDYGIVGTMGTSVETESLKVELFMLSCRALGKGVEREMMIHLGKKALKLQLESVEIAYRKTDRNEPCRRFLEEIGAILEEDSGVFRLSAADAANLSPVPESAPKPTALSGAASSTMESPWNREFLIRMASDWCVPANLDAHLSSIRRPRPEIAGRPVKAGSEIQKKLVAIWEEVLEVSEVGITDTFASLGGTSIQMVMVYARLKREFGVTFELSELFTLPTIKNIEDAIKNGKSGAPKVEVRESNTNDQAGDDQIAIVGMALRVPGADDPDQFWENLVSGKESISRFEKEELAYPDEYESPGFVPAKGIIEGIDLFDASFFGILPKDAEIMDPQQRIFLELAWEAMEKAGYQPDNHSERIGVYAGAYFDTYLLTNLCTDQKFLHNLIPQIQVGSLQTELGNDKDYLATRVAFKLNLRGPAMTLQTACSTSMVAIAEACRSIRDGLCDMALAGGVTVTLPYKRGYFFTEQGMLSKDGHCCAFDEKASGTVFANGAGVIMLKRLSDAVRDRDHIHAVIRGTGMNNDGGVKHSYTAPSVDGQVGVIQMAHRDAGVSADTITAIEAHGTGTPLGDPIEVTALTKAFRSSGVSENQYCAIGSLKTNVGHLDVASGVCGVIKTALSLEHKTLVPLLHFEKANPKIDFGNSPFYPNTSLRPWERKTPGIPLRAGVSSFGVGGTNVHAVLEEAPEVISEPSPRDKQLVVLSARSESALNQAAENLGSFGGDADLADVAWTMAIGRKPFRFRRVAVAADFGELKEILKKPASRTADRNDPPVNFMFPGQGAQHVRMAESFYRSEPRFRALLDRCSTFLEPFLGESLTDVLFPADESQLGDAAERLKNTTLAQPAIFVIEYALADLWMHWGVTPRAMIGHSVGEFVAACHAGVFTLEEGLKLLADRGRLMGEMPGGGMLSVRMPEADLVKRIPDSLDLAAVNSPGLCVVAGPHEALKAFAAELDADGIVAKPLHTSHAFHSRMMDSVIEPFTACFEAIELKAPEIPIFSTVTREWLTAENATDAGYWARHLRETVCFADAVSALGDEAEEQIFIEVGPGQTLTGLARQSLDRKAKHIALSTCQHVQEEGSDQAQMLQSLGRLWMEGVEVDWNAYYGDEVRKRIPLPTYPFERKRHWVEPTVQGTVEECTLYSPEVYPIQSQQSQESIVNPPNSTAVEMSAPNASRSETLTTAICEKLTDLSGIPGDEMAGDATLLELGFDSLLLTQVGKALNDEFGTNIKMRDLMTDLSTIDLLVAYLDETLPQESYREAIPEPIATVSVSQPVPSVIAPVAPQLNGTVEAVIAQQMALMQQQLELLRGGAVAPPAATVSNPVKPVVKSKVSKVEGGSSKDVSAPSTAISRDIDENLTPQQQAHLDELISRYTEKTASSKALTAEYRQWYADPRTVSGFNRLWKEMIYQIVVEKSKGSRLLDIDGNEYIDMLNGFGPGFLGHSPDQITSVLHRQLDRGVEVGPQCRDAMEAAKLFCELTGNERASFVNTGSEAVQAAMRMTRTVTGRDKIVVFTKDYHGNFDEVLVRAVGSGEKLRSMPVAPGIPNRAVEDVIVLPYGTDEALEVIRARAHELAAVIVEPIQSRRPEFQPHEFIKELREITRQSGTALVFDEVITGFRTGPRGAQEYYGVEADVATYGKVVGAGMPVGVVAGKAEYMDTFDGGQWQYGDDSFPEQGVTFFAGTFVRHPLAMAAVKEMLLYLKEVGPDLWTDLKAKANRLASTVDQMFVENEIPFRMPNFGSQMFVRHIDDNKYANLLFFHLRSKGVFLLEGFPSYMTTAHTDEDVDYVIEAFRETIGEMQEAGFFPRPESGGIKFDQECRLTGPPAILLDQVKHAEPKIYPLTEPQAEIWLASQISSDSTLCFNEVVKLDFRGELDPQALSDSLKDLVDRHESLRTRFLDDGEGFQIRPKLQIILNEKILESVDQVEEELIRERTTSFDLSEDPLFRATLLKIEEDHQVLILCAHHLVCDGWSYNVVTSDLSQIYAAKLEGKKAALPPAPRFSTYAMQVLRKEIENDGGNNEAFWLSKFEEPVPPLNLPHEVLHANASPSFRSDRIIIPIDDQMRKSLKRVAGKSGATLFAILMGSFQILLGRIGRQNRVMTLFPVAEQNSSKGYENLVGHCVNFLPFISNIRIEDSFGTFLEKIQQNLLDTLDHKDFTYGQLIKKLAPTSRPEVEAVFNLERMDGYDEFSGLKSEIEDVSRMYAMDPLFLNAMETGQGIELHLTYQTDLFTADTARNWLNTYVAILEKVIESPGLSVSQVGAVMAPGHLDLMRQWNNTETDFPKDRSVNQLFDETVAVHRDRIALKQQGRELTYSELGDMVNRIAGYLLESGVGKGDYIGTLLDQGPERIASIFSILKLGAAFVPLDPTYPDERIQFMLDDSDVSCVVTSGALKDRLSGKKSIVLIEDVSGDSVAEVPTVAVSSAQAAYIIYTSGSAGVPKGVVVPHQGIVRLVRNTNYCEFGVKETFLQGASICFDAATFEIFGSLLNGGALALPDPGPLTLESISKTIKDCEVSTLWLTSGLFQMMVEEDISVFSGVRQLLTGGDVVPVTHARMVLEAHPDLTLINGYGPTENTTFTTTHRVSAADLNRESLPIGRPVSNTTAWILDSSGNLVVPGIAGELYCGGSGLASEYLNNPELTAEKFVDVEIEGRSERLYRTGDLCRFRTDGVVEFLGRIDEQVKIRGFRIEPGEVEARLAGNPEVSQCKVVVNEVDSGGKALIAYVTPKNGSTPSSGSLKDYLRDKLPDYMVPSSYVVLDEFPVTPNGKIDAKALPDPNQKTNSVGLLSSVPESDLEIWLAKQWKDILAIPSVSLDDDFFSLGGHSLLSMKLFGRIQREYGVSLPLSVLFRSPTVKTLAEEVANRDGCQDGKAEENGSSAVAETTVLLQPKGERPPLFAVHGGDGGIFFYRDLAERLEQDRPFYAFEAAVLTGGGPIREESVPVTAHRYVKELEKIHPTGSVYLCGYSFGGVVAYEMACQLTEKGRKVEFVGLVDTENPAGQFAKLNLSERIAVNWNDPRTMETGTVQKVIRLGRRVGKGLGYRLRFSGEDMVAKLLPVSRNMGWLRRIQVRLAYERAMSRYEPPRYVGNLTLFRALDENDKQDMGDNYGWSEVVDGEIETIDIPGNHITVFHKENIEGISKEFRACLSRRKLESSK
ncbi:MAG: amino acid adenylation domain-containing protein [Verrucomicrobiales bacterium]|nr:amino acid adenylation domain-containing protein [Verrucomicrobiales bacterium]